MWFAKLLERFVDRIASWNDETLLRYIRRGEHHLRYTKEKNERVLLFELVNLLAVRKENKARMVQKLKNIDLPKMLLEIKSLIDVSNVVPFSMERYRWIERILKVRYKILNEELMK